MLRLFAVGAVVIISYKWPEITIIDDVAIQKLVDAFFNELHMTTRLDLHHSANARRMQIAPISSFADCDMTISLRKGCRNKKSLHHQHARNYEFDLFHNV